MKTTRKTFTDCKGRDITVSYLTLGGKRPGPVLTIVAGQHGMEHSGPCFLPELAEELDKVDFAGTLHICPCANPAALEIDYEFYPEREDIAKINDYYYSYFRHYHCPWGLGRNEATTMYNMNRTWNKQGDGIAFEITKWLWSEIVESAFLTVDIHCAPNQKPFIYNDSAKNNPFVAMTGIESALQCFEERDEYASGNLNYQASKRPGRHAFCVEFSVQHGLNEFEYTLGKNMIKNLMIGMHMMPGKIIPGPHPCRAIPHAWDGHFYAKHAGHMRFFFANADEVKKGDKVYEIRDIQTLEVLECGIAPRDGVMIGTTTLPLAKPEMYLCSVATYENLTCEEGFNYAQ